MGALMQPCVARDPYGKLLFGNLCPYPNIEVVFVDLRQIFDAPSSVIFRYFWDYLLMLMLVAVSEVAERSTENAARSFSLWTNTFNQIVSRFDIDEKALLKKFQDALLVCVMDRQRIWTVLNPILPYNAHSLIAKHISLLPRNALNQWQTWLTQFFENPKTSLAKGSSNELKPVIDSLVQGLRQGYPPSDVTELHILVGYSANAAYMLYADVYFLLRLQTKHGNVKKVFGYLEDEHAQSIAAFFTDIKKTHDVVVAVKREPFIKNFMHTRCLQLRDQDLIVV